MLSQINTFFIVLSVIFISVKVIDFVLNLYQDDPKTITYNVYEKIILYLSFSYIITNLLI